jgi:hypothetical protein
LLTRPQRWKVFPVQYGHIFGRISVFGLTAGKLRVTIDMAGSL